MGITGFTIDKDIHIAYENRIEIVSLGILPPGQTKEGFFSGVSIPVNKKLSEILLQLHISEKSGRCVPRIVHEYGQQAVEFKDNAIAVTIPFNRLYLGATPQDTPQVTSQDTPQVAGEKQNLIAVASWMISYELYRFIRFVCTFE